MFFFWILKYKSEKNDPNLKKLLFNLISYYLHHNTLFKELSVPLLGLHHENAVKIYHWNKPLPKTASFRVTLHVYGVLKNTFSTATTLSTAAKGFLLQGIFEMKMSLTCLGILVPIYQRNESAKSKRISFSIDEFPATMLIVKVVSQYFNHFKWKTEF